MVTDTLTLAHLPTIHQTVEEEDKSTNPISNNTSKFSKFSTILLKFLLNCYEFYKILRNFNKSFQNFTEMYHGKLTWLEFLQWRWNITGWETLSSVGWTMRSYGRLEPFEWCQEGTMSGARTRGARCERGLIVSGCDWGTPCAAVLAGTGTWTARTVPVGDNTATWLLFFQTIPDGCTPRTVIATNLQTFASQVQQMPTNLRKSRSNFKEILM